MTPTPPELEERSPGEEKVSSINVRLFDKQGRGVDQSQWVVREQPVTLYLNGREIVTLLCAGHHLEELAVGFFYAEGFLKKPSDLKDLRVRESEGRVDVVLAEDPSLPEQLWSKRTVTSGCGKGSLFYHAIDALLSRPVESTLSVTPLQIQARVEDLSRLSETYRRTHGVHNTALATPERILLFRDDIGRHNAADMVVGHVFLKGIPLHDKILITTGRLTSEIVLKVARVQIPILVSRNAATTLAVSLAQSLNLTLIGYARAGKFTVYCGAERLQSESIDSL